MCVCLSPFLCPRGVVGALSEVWDVWHNIHRSASPASETCYRNSYNYISKNKMVKYRYLPSWYRVHTAAQCSQCAEAHCLQRCKSHQLTIDSLQIITCNESDTYTNALSNTAVYWSYQDRIKGINTQAGYLFLPGVEGKFIYGMQLPAP
eukprot:7561900-Pyramimonas_sp.AAC.2